MSQEVFGTITGLEERIISEAEAIPADHDWMNNVDSVCKNVNQKYDPDSQIYLNAVLKPNYGINSCKIFAIRRTFPPAFSRSSRMYYGIWGK